MSEEFDWEIPLSAQPKPEQVSFDLESALGAVVGLRATIPEDAFTAGILGTERTGNGVLISDSGLVVTIGYLVAEAESVWLTAGDGSVLAGHALGYDFESGFGLVQALGRFHVPAGCPSGDPRASCGRSPSPRPQPPRPPGSGWGERGGSTWPGAR